jgi:hypothetical protein
MTTIAPEREATIITDRPAPELDGDHERMSHYVTKDAQEAAWLTGEPTVALCGKVWLPTRDGQKFPLCPECEELMEMGPDGRVNHFRKRAENGE